MIVEKLILDNYRSYEHSEVDWDLIFVIEPGDLTNPNDCGKTHILRALRMILFHESFPISHLRYGQKTGYVEVHLSNGYKIRRAWEDKEHYTYVIDPKNTVTKLKGTNDSAALVKNITGFQKVKLEEKDSTGLDFNFINTRRTPPLLDERGDTILKKLSLIMGCQEIEEVVSSLSSELTKVNSEITKLEKVSLSSKEVLDSKQNLLNEIDLLLKGTNKKEEEIKSLESKLEKLKKLSITSKKITLIEMIPDKLSSINASVASLKKSVKQGYSIVELLNKYNSSNDMLIQTEKDITITNETLTQLNKDKLEILKQLGICPTCGSNQ